MCDTQENQEMQQKLSSLKHHLKIENLWCKYLIGPIQERTLTRATYATKPSVAEISQKWRVLKSLERK